jgi:hypothetical protein
MISASPIATSIPAKVRMIIENMNPTASSITSETSIKPRLAAKNIISKLISIDIRFLRQIKSPITPRIKILVGKTIVKTCSSSIM